MDGLGNQAHVDETYLPSLEEVFTITDHFATIVPHQAVTEFDITTLNDEEIVADYTRNLLIACFSHPVHNGFLFGDSGKAIIENRKLRLGITTGQ